MDKPLSQERRKLIAIPEERYKRLQAIELERDQYKLALEKLDAVFDFSDKIRTNEEIFIDDPTEINEALDFAYSLINPEQHAINKALEGVDTNE